MIKPIQATLGGVLLMVGGCFGAIPLLAGHADFCGVGPDALLEWSARSHLEPPVGSTGHRTLLFLRVRFADDSSDPISLSEAEATLDELSAIFDRMSHGNFLLSSTVTPVLQLTATRHAYEGPGGFDRLLDDARQAGLEAGFNYLDFDLDVVRHSGVPGFQGGNARLGTRGAQVQAPGALILVHEIGHNLGLWHANFWDTAGPGISLSSPPLPSNYETLPDPRTIPIHPESAVGHDTVIGPGSAIEYGDLWDIMGMGDDDFNATTKRRLGWLPESAIIVAPTGMSLQKIHSLDASSTNHPRSIHIPGPRNGPAGDRDYTIELPARQGGVLPSPGLLIRWIDPSVAAGGSLLLDGTANTPDANSDAILRPGRTFSDRVSGVHVTLTAWGTDTDGQWGEVAVFVGDTSTNSPPSVVLAIDPAVVEPGDVVRLTATASDPNGDALAWHWNFGDGTSSTNAPVIDKAWSRPGHHVIRVEVSDLKGGVATAQQIIEVGTVETLRITGRVRDPDGNPVGGVKVHNGIIPGGETPVRQVITETDLNGDYVLTGLVPGRYPVSAFHPDYRMERRPPVSLVDEDVAGVDFVAIPLPRVSVSGPGEISEAGGLSVLYTFTRTGPTDAPLTVRWRLGGTAVAFDDYIPPLLAQVEIPAGSRSATVPIQLVDDTQGESIETLTVTVVEPARMDRFDDKGGAFAVFYPGWEILQENEMIFWTRTRPEYVPDAGAQVIVTVIDDDAPTDHNVSLHASDIIALEQPLVESEFLLQRTGSTQQPLRVLLATSGSAMPGVDFEPLPSEVAFLPGEMARVIPVRPIADDVVEPIEEVVLQILPDPAYGIGNASASVTIRDTISFPQILSLGMHLSGQLELTMEGPAGSRLVLERSPDLQHWEPIRTNQLFNSTKATMLISPGAGREFYRTVR